MKDIRQQNDNFIVDRIKSDEFFRELIVSLGTIDSIISYLNQIYLPTYQQLNQVKIWFN